MANMEKKKKSRNPVNPPDMSGDIEIKGPGKRNRRIYSGKTFSNMEFEPCTLSLQGQSRFLMGADFVISCDVIGLGEKN